MSWLTGILGLLGGVAIVILGLLGGVAIVTGKYDLAQCMLLWIIIGQLDGKK